MKVVSTSEDGYNITNFRFEVDIVVNAVEVEEIGVLVVSLDITTTTPQ